MLTLPCGPKFEKGAKYEECIRQDKYKTVYVHFQIVFFLFSGSVSTTLFVSLFGGEVHHESSVSSPRTPHNDPG